MIRIFEILVFKRIMLKAVHTSNHATGINRWCADFISHGELVKVRLSRWLQNWVFMPLSTLRQVTVSKEGFIMAAYHVIMMSGGEFKR